MRSFATKENWGGGGESGNKNQRRKTNNRVEQRERGMREERNHLGLSQSDKLTIYNKQKGRSLYCPRLAIDDYHHVPSIRDISESGIVVKGGGKEVAVGVDNIAHALFHWAEYLLTGDQRHWNDTTGIMCRYDDEMEACRAQDEFEERMKSREFENIINFVRARRKQYNLDYLKVRLDQVSVEIDSQEALPRGRKLVFGCP